MLNQNNTLTSLSTKIIFWGTPEFALPSLKSVHDLGFLSLVITQPDRQTGRGKKMASSPVKEYALENNIAILEPEKLDQSFTNALKKYLPATFLVVAYGKIIPQEILDLSQLPAINIHPSMLPELRGPSPIQTAILRGFESTGLSLMQLDKKMDHGPILGQIQVKIDPNESYIELSQRLAIIGAQILSEKLPDYLAGKISPLPQDDDKATYCKMISKEDGRIDWQKSAQEIHNQVRAFYPWPSAYTKLGDLDIKILKTEVVDIALTPGEINNDLVVGTSEKSLKILELQPANKKILKAAEFVRGYFKYLSQKFS
ncbi:methionyl-tRNA formyltransferase [Patescibacteria group bacterium]|nr:methionyl-tRNA formyltransferase [Patescibacteria group bacterium]